MNAGQAFAGALVMISGTWASVYLASHALLGAGASALVVACIVSLAIVGRKP